MSRPSTRGVALSLLVAAVAGCSAGTGGAGDGGTTRYTVTFDSAGGSAVPAQTVAAGGLVTRPSDPVRSGFVFGGWYRDAGLASVWSFAADRVQGDLTIHARWSDASTVVAVAVDRAAKYQTIDGFGFFGAMDCWWGNASDMISDAWAAQVLGDLGITIWRNEYYPPADAIAGQDADWSKQEPVVRTLKRLADLNQIPLKFVFTVWSPPSAMKCVPDENHGYFPIEGTNPRSTKGGNTLCRNSWDDFAAWLVAGVKLYQDAGVSPYALSFQNEPYFWEPYNSCFYVQDYYAQTLAYVGPKVKAAYPSIKLFGAENMLEMEGGSDRRYFYTGTIQANAAASAALDVIAVHGYSDGVLPTSSSKMAALWSAMSSDFATPMNKPLWMTETSGYVDTWVPSSGSGALDLANTIYAALKYGHLSGWVWWQGSQLDEINAYDLMLGTAQRSKRYYVSKQFYRFIRPGARMVKVDSADEGILAVAFEHTGMSAFTAVLINTTAQPRTVTLTGAGIPATLEQFTTTSTLDCVDAGSVAAGAITLPPSSVNTVVSGNVYESGSPVFATH